MKRHCVYRYFSQSGQLLYVGSSGDIMSRALSHELKSWHQCVDKITLSWFPSRDAARAAEKEIIASEAPLHNRHHNITRYVKKGGGAYEPIC